MANQAVKMRAELLAYTPYPLELIYTAAKQCYSEGSAADLWPMLTHHTGGPSAEEMAKFVRKPIAAGHTSIAEHVYFTFAVDGVSRALTHQLVRHRIASYSQQSQRYVDATNINFVVPPEVAKVPEALAMFNDVMDVIAAGYAGIRDMLIANGRDEKQANEDARYLLPNAGETKIVVTMNCRGLLNFFAHRCCTRAQWEVRDMANAMLRACRQRLPVIFARAGAHCERLGYCPEGKFSCSRYPADKE